MTVKGIIKSTANVRTLLDTDAFLFPNMRFANIIEQNPRKEGDRKYMR